LAEKKIIIISVFTAFVDRIKSGMEYAWVFVRDWIKGFFSMKKIFAFVISFVLLMIPLAPCAAEEKSSAVLFVNGSKMAVLDKVQLSENTVWVGVRQFVSVLGYHPYYDRKSRTVYIPGTSLKVQLDSKNKDIRINDGHLYLPATDVASIFGFDVYIDNIGQKPEVTGIFLAKNFNEHFRIFASDEAVKYLKPGDGYFETPIEMGFIFRLSPEERTEFWNDPIVPITPEQFKKAMSTIRFPIDHMVSHSVYLLPYIEENGLLDAYTTKEATVFLGQVDVDKVFPYGTLENKINSIITHEFGHRVFWAYLDEKKVSEYIKIRGLDSNIGHPYSYFYDTQEVFAEDFRVLFGNSKTSLFSHMNKEIKNPKNIPELRLFFERLIKDGPKKGY